jgi:Maltogenic Amylase, C-terminal domain/Alpha amylase, catalytic domain
MRAPARPYRLPDWLARGICYELTVPAFADSDSDGIGDLPGVADRLDYLDWLGVDCLWLTDCPSAVDGAGALVGAAHQRGLRVLADVPPGPAGAMVRTVHSWLDAGVDGLRVDRGAVSVDVLRRCRTVVGARSGSVLLPAPPRSVLLPTIVRALRERSAPSVSPLLDLRGGLQGLRTRRPAPLLGNDRNRLELCAALQLSLPGVPHLYYGDEIGMTRAGSATNPMQWTGGHNAGFSDCAPELLTLPLVQDSVYGYRAVNVASQRANRSSLLNWLRERIAVRRAAPALTAGGALPVPGSNPKVVGYLRTDPGGRGPDLACVCNFSPVPEAVELDLAGHRGVLPVELTGGAEFPRVGAGPYQLTLPGYGFYWLSLQAAA